MMGHIVKNKPWGIIDLDTSAGRIFFQERWKYDWLTAPGVSIWTLEKKREFHKAVDTQVWRYWSNLVKFRISGTAPLCRRFATISINFDIRWVTARQHWTVRVKKLPAGSTPTTHISNVDRPNRVINLDSADLDVYRACNAAARCREFKAVPHEFGHSFPGVNDEYNAGHAKLSDTNSMMNIGQQIRTRHLQPILDELNKMIPDCTFSHP